ncbi:MAG TPA: DUF11 domain-containing protein, partial [Candidatus Hydrogenedentes bacterium]|nr:DUF11 domain-containing protein [Candidatus Hydrogenedentota bacterium]
AFVAPLASAQTPADLVISKDDDETQLYPGQQVRYVITVANVGPADLVGAEVEDILPAALLDATWTSVATGAATAGSGSGDLVDTADIPSGDMVIYTLVATLASDAEGVLINTATVAVPAGFSDINPEDNTATDTDVIEAEPVANIRPVFSNQAPTPNALGNGGAAPPNGAAAFGGHIGDRSAAPDPERNQPRYILRTSSFGQPLARYKASPTHLEDTLDDARRQLFYIQDEPERNDAAFRYIHSFFGIGTTGVVDGLQMRLENPIPYDAIIDPYDGEESDEERALRVADDVVNALRFEPFNKDLRNLWLDIYYYRTLGRQITAKDQVVRAYQINFSTEVSQQEPFGGPINKEIAAFTVATEALAGVLDPYKELLFDNLGVDISEFDPEFSGNMPFGYYLFLKEVPYRSVYAATFLEFDEETHEFVNESPQAVDLEETVDYSVLYVAPTGHNVDYTGAPNGADEAEISFTITNIGAGQLDWKASLKNPTDPLGNTSAMLSLKNADEEEIQALTGSVPVGGDRDVTVYIAKNYSPLLRVGKVTVEDTGSGRDNGIVYEVVIVQAGNPKPIIFASVSEIAEERRPSQAPYVEREVLIRNAGIGALNWSASIIAPQGSTNIDWVELQGPFESDYGSTASGVNYGILELRINASYSLAQDPVQVKIVGDDPETLPVYIDVYIEDNPPQNKSAIAKTASEILLTVYPETIYTAKEAVERNFVVKNSPLFTWTAALTQGGSWLTIASVDPASGLVELAVAQNAGAEAREGVVTIASTDTTPSTRTVIVKQDGASDTALTVNPTTRIVPATAGMATSGPAGKGFAVAPAGSGNISWTARVIEGQDWLTIYSEPAGQNEGEVLFAYDQNPRTNGRTGQIEIESPDAIAGQNRIIVEVIQRGTSGAAVLTAGFKDLALLFEVMRDEAQVRKELAKRLALRSLSGDLQQANGLIAETLTRHSAALSDIGDLIPDWRDLIDPSSDLIATYFGWQQAVEQLNTTRDFINGNANVLGFQKDFLFLVQRFPGQPGDLFDSFDKLFTYMYDGENDTAVLASPLGYAYDKYQTARAEYGTYTNTQDELREELRTQNLEHRKWMFDVIGVDPGNDVDHPNDPDRYYHPSQNYGSEMWQQARSIERAQEQLRQNGAELQQIYNEINTELWRRSQETQINAQIADVYVQYGDKLATIEEEIGAINAAQVLADNIAEAFGVDKAVSGGSAAKVANGFIQAAAEIAKGFLEGEKVRLAAQENQVIRQLEDKILEANSQALIANLHGQAAVIGVQSAELMLALAQEVGRRQALNDEWHYRESLMRENNRALLGRSFANPVHRLRMRRAMLEAEASFKVAQRWVFFTIRALEYKWNTPFVHSNAAGDWSMASVFRSRTAKDLIDLMAAVKDFDGLLQGSSRADDRFDWFSFKKDFMGLTPQYDTDGETELRVFAHPLTGYAATSAEVFHAKLDEAYSPSTGIITLPFSTFRDNGETFFRGPRRDPNDLQTVLSRGQYLDKIVWMKINLLGDFENSDRTRLVGALTYSGGSYVRNARVGYMPDPTRPNVIEDEFSRWSTKFWFYDSGLPQADPPVPAAWRSNDEQTTEVALSLTSEPRLEMPDTVSRIDVFQERSVACDSWVLKIFIKEGGEQLVQIADIDDIEIFFYHMSKDRPDFPTL